MMSSLCTISDLCISDQLEIYHRAQQIKHSIIHNEAVPGNSKSTVYLIFLEDSTRTKESFRNAALFNGSLVNIFDCTSSSLNKHETITDTVKMLCGYSVGPVTFVIRSRIEGLCRWLADSIPKYAARNSLPPINFINAGDGRHEHPTQELLDEFTFLEQVNFDRACIHVALIGDLLNGRTIHSKTDGLKVFEKVEIDLIAPVELSLPDSYLARMKANGFVIRSFESLDAYLNQGSVAKIFYFTRLQLERMAQSILKREIDLRFQVSLRLDMVDRLPKGCKFYHPLPRNGKFPEIPFEIDDTDLNGWDRQSRNGYFVRIALLQFLSGKAQEISEAHSLNGTCSNIDCVSHKANGQREVVSSFITIDDVMVCRYCEKLL